MSEHPNAAVVRRAYEAFAAGDIATLTETIAEDAIWHIGGDNTFSGDYEGRDSIFTHFMTIGGETAGTLSLEIHDVLATDEHAVALLRERGQRNGRALDMNKVHVYHVRDGQAIESWEYSEDQAAYDAFWS